MEEPNSEIVGARFEMDLEPDKEQTTTDYQEVNGFDPNGFETADRINSYPAGNSSALGAVANYMNTIVGAAIVGLPFALKQSGLWAGIIMLCLAAFLNGWSTYALIAAGEKMGKLNYEELMRSLFGTPGVHAFCVFAGILAFGSMSAYLIVIGDVVPEILLATNVVSGAFTDRHSAIAFFGIVFVLPVSLLKDLSKLAYTSLASVCSVGVLGLIVIFAGPSEASGNADIDRSEVLDFMRPSIFAGFGAMSFAFVCQQSSFLVYRSMKEGGLKRWAGVTKWSMSIAWIMSLILSVSGYIIFGSETQGNILNNFSPGNVPATVARGFLTVTMLFTYPIEMYVARHVFHVSIFQTFLGMGPITSTRHYTITLLIWTFTMTVACATHDLSIVLDIFGALSSTVIGYILPALLHISCNREDIRRAGALWRKDSPEYDTSLCSRLWALRIFCLPVFMVVFGIVAMVVGVVSAVWFELKNFGLN